MALTKIVKYGAAAIQCLAARNQVKDVEPAGNVCMTCASVAVGNQY